MAVETLSQTRQAQRAVGKRVPRHDAIYQVTGKVCFTEDLRIPGMLHARFLRSRYPHARILSVDTTQAAAAPGVAAVITAGDVPYNRMGSIVQDQPVLADDRVRYIGDPVAAVAAETAEAAFQALRLIKVEYEELPAVYDPVEAMKPGAPILHGESNVLVRQGLRCGDVERGFAASHLVVEETYQTQMVEHCGMETQVSVAVPDLAGNLIVYTPSARPYAIRAEVARVLQAPLLKIRVIAMPQGGGFGGKNDPWLEPAVGLLALKTGRPVRAVLSREEEFTASTVRHPIRMHYRSGVDSSGKLLARQVKLVLDTGAYAALGYVTIRKATLTCIGPYRVPNVLAEGVLVFTNNTVASAMRGFGVPQTCFAWESHMETIARQLGMDSLKLRLLNAFEDGDTTPYGQTLTSVGLKESMRQAAAAFDWRRESRS